MQVETFDEFMKKTSNHSVSEEEISFLISDPMAWLKLKLRERKKYDGIRYLLTFTRNPNSNKTLPQWYARVYKELQRQTFSNVTLAIEHPTTNIHIHAVVDANKPISKTLFKVFARDYGYTDTRRVNIDNGLIDYISKESDPKNLNEFKEIILSYNNNVTQTLSQESTTP